MMFTSKRRSHNNFEPRTQFLFLICSFTQFWDHQNHETKELSRNLWCVNCNEEEKAHRFDLVSDSKVYKKEIRRTRDYKTRASFISINTDTTVTVFVFISHVVSPVFLIVHFGSSCLPCIRFIYLLFRWSLIVRTQFYTVVVSVQHRIFITHKFCNMFSYFASVTGTENFGDEKKKPKNAFGIGLIVLKCF